MHDFDPKHREQQQRSQEEFGDHQFTLRGQTFRIRRIIPFGVLRKISAVRSGSGDFEAFEAFETAVLALLATDDDRERFRNLIYDTNAEFPLTYLELLEVQDWIMREASGRPPTQPSSSSESPSTNGSAGTATSSDEPAAASTS